MNKYNFTADLSGSVFRLLGRILMPSFIVTLLFALVLGLSAYLIMPDLSSDQEDITELVESASEYDPEELNLILTERIMSVFSDNAGAFIPLLVILMLLSFVIYNFSYNLSSNEVENSNNSFSAALKNLFDKRLIHYFVLAIIIGGLYQFLNYLVQMTGMSGLIFLFLVTILPVYCWFHLSYAAVGIGNMNFKEALSFVQGELSLSRVAKVLGIGILFLIVSAVMVLIVSVLGALLYNIPVVGVVLGILLGVFSYTVYTSFILAGFTGLYYRYALLETEEDEQFIVTD